VLRTVCATKTVTYKVHPRPPPGLLTVSRTKWNKYRKEEVHKFVPSIERNYDYDIKKR